MGAAARALILDLAAAIFDAVGPLDHERQRQAGDGRAARIAQQAGEIDRLARAVDAALGVEIGVEPGGSDAALHAAIREIEGGLLQVEKAVILAQQRGDEAGRIAALALAQRRVEAGIAIGVAADRGQDLVVAGDEPQFGIGDGRGVGERAHQHMHAVGPGKRGQAEIGDDEPLRRARRAVVIVAIGIGRDRRARARRPAWRTSHRRRASARRPPPSPGRR